MIPGSSNSRWSLSRQPGRSFLVAATLAAVGLLVAHPSRSHAQDSGTSMAQRAVNALTDDQQSAAKSALCSAVASQISNPSAATPSDLSSSGVISAAAATFASNMKLPLSSATPMLQGYVSQHATEILTSCAASNATGGITSKIPGASSIPSIPKMPSY
jgi:hypothetical protein